MRWLKEKLRGSEERGVFLRQSRRPEFAAEKNVPRLPGGDSPPFATHFVRECDKAAADVRHGCGNADFLIESRRAQMSALRLRDGEENAVFEFHLAVMKPDAAAVFDPRDLHPDEVVCIINDAHLIGF